MKSILVYFFLLLLAFMVFDALTLILSSSFALWALYYFTNKQKNKNQL
jgi:hypothetical protein